MPTTTRNPRGRVFGAANWCDNPCFQSNTTGWSYGWFGSGTSGTNDRGTGGVGQYGKDAAIRKTWTSSSPGATPEAGFYYTLPASLGWGAGKVFYASGFVKMSQQQTLVVRAKYFDGGNNLLGTQDGTHIFPAYNQYTKISGGPFTVPAGTATVQVWFCTTGENGAIPSGTTMLLSCVMLADVQAVNDGAWFDGNDGAYGDYSYGWTGTPGNSWSIRYVSDPASAITPPLGLGWEDDSPANNIVHTLLSGAIVVVQRPGGPRTGTLKLFFGRDRAGANNCRAQHRLAGVWTYTDALLPETGMTYVVAGGSVRTYLDDERLAWTCEVPFQEVT